jgi:hypothetical protein
MQLKVEQIQVKEYGVAFLMENLFTEILSALQEHFPDTWQTTICLTRECIVRFCRSFKIRKDCVLFDGTDLFSHSGQMELPKFSKSKFGAYDGIYFEYALQSSV